MTNTELLALFRIDVDDLEATYLWSDTSVYGWIDEAQKQFCRDTQGIADARSFRLNISVAKQWYAVDPRILKIRGAMNQATGAEVPLIALERMGTHDMVFNGATGVIKALITGMEKNQLRAYPVPNATATVELHTFRLSTDMATGDDFEIDAQHVRNLLMWVKHRAYGVQDSEVYDKNKSANFKAEFGAYCRRVIDEQSRLSHIAGTVAYGGI